MPNITDSTLTERESILRAKREWEYTFDAVSDLIFIVDNDHNIIRANRAMADHLGCDAKELVGRKCFELMHDTDAPILNCPHSIMLESGKPKTAEFRIHKNNDIFEVTTSPMFDEHGIITASVHVGRDITDKINHAQLLAAQQKELEDINNSLESRIEEAVAESRKKDDIIIQQSRLTAMGEMLSNIAHQWRQPLNNIGLIVQSMQLAYKANDLTQQEMDIEIAETMRILQYISETIDDFRNYFSYESETSSFNINEIISRSLTLIEPSLLRRGITVKLNAEADVVAVGYPNEYMQAFLNIMLNAKDALLAANIPHPQINIDISMENGRSVLAILDNAGGISKDIMTKIFDPYFSTKKTTAGAGIGLYMVKMIIEKKMNGIISVRNINGGAEFKIII